MKNVTNLTVSDIQESLGNWQVLFVNPETDKKLEYNFYRTVFAVFESGKAVLFTGNVGDAVNEFNR